MESGIQAEPSKSTAEKMQMMELLKRLEKESAEEDPNMLEEDEEDEEDDLAQRLEGMDLGESSNYAGAVYTLNRLYDRICTDGTAVGDVDTRGA